MKNQSVIALFAAIIAVFFVGVNNWSGAQEHQPNQQIIFSGNKFTIPSPAGAKFEPDFKRNVSGPFILAATFAVRDDSGKRILALYHLSRMSELPGIPKIYSPMFTEFAEGRKGESIICWNGDFLIEKMAISVQNITANAITLYFYIDGSIVRLESIDFSNSYDDMVLAKTLEWALKIDGLAANKE